MADQQIDELSLKIEVKENNTAKTLTAISSAIDKLTSSLKGLSKFSALIDQVAKIKLPGGVAKTAKAAASAPKLKEAPVLKNESAKEAAEVFQNNLAQLVRKTQLKSASKDVAQRFADTSFQRKPLQNATQLEEDAKRAEKAASSAAEAYASVKNSMSLVSRETKKLAGGTQQVVEKFELVTKTGKKTVTAIDGVVKSTKESSVATKKAATSWSKLTRSVGRIAFYRTIRLAIKEIAQTWREGLQNFVQYDESTNKAMSDMMNSWTQIKNTIGVTASYLMQTLAPIITTLADKVVDLLNNLNMAMAKSQGKDQFAKAKKGADDYAKTLQKVNGQLLSFDTFTLGAKGDETSAQDMFEEGNVNEEWNETAETFASIIELVGTVFQSVKTIIEPLKPLLNVLANALNSVIQSVAKSLSSLLEKLAPVIADLLVTLVPIIIDFINMITPLLEQLITDILPDVIDFIGSWLREVVEIVRVLIPIIKMIFEALKPFLKIFMEQMLSQIQMLVSILEIITPILDFIFKLLEPVAKFLDTIASKIANFGKGLLGGIKSIFGFAGGGNYRTGDFFVANENGATEMIASTNNGGSVMNIDQWASVSYSSFFRALSDYGAARDDGGNSPFNMDAFGRAIAGNRGFINEINRRNALNLR